MIPFDGECQRLKSRIWAFFACSHNFKMNKIALKNMFNRNKNKLLTVFDDTLGKVLTSILNVDMSDEQWIPYACTWVVWE